MADLLIIAAIVLILGLAGRYVYKEKNASKTCVGCPYGGNCSGCCGKK